MRAGWGGSDSNLNSNPAPDPGVPADAAVTLNVTPKAATGAVETPVSAFITCQHVPSAQDVTLCSALRQCASIVQDTERVSLQQETSVDSQQPLL